MDRNTEFHTRSMETKLFSSQYIQSVALCYQNNDAVSTSKILLQKKLVNRGNFTHLRKLKLQQFRLSSIIMSTLHFSIKEHVLDASYVREYPRALANNQNDVLKLHIKQYIPKISSQTSKRLTIIGAHANAFPKVR